MTAFQFDDDHWPILAALAWIARRRKEDVDAFAAELAAPGSCQQEMITPAGEKVIAPVTSAPPNVLWLNEYFAWEEIEGGEPIQSVFDCTNAFIKAARAGKVTVSGTCGTGVRTELPTLQLQDMHFEELYGSEFVLEPGHWRKLLCKRSELLAAFPSAALPLAQCASPRSITTATQAVPAECVSTAEIFGLLERRTALHSHIMQEFEAANPGVLSAKKDQRADAERHLEDGWQYEVSLEEETCHSALRWKLQKAVSGHLPALQLYYRDSANGDWLRAPPNEFEGEFSELSLARGSPPLFGDTPADRVYFAKWAETTRWLDSLYESGGRESVALVSLPAQTPKQMAASKALAALYPDATVLTKNMRNAMNAWIADPVNGMSVSAVSDRTMQKVFAAQKLELAQRNAN